MCSSLYLALLGVFLLLVNGGPLSVVMPSVVTIDHAIMPQLANESIRMFRSPFDQLHHPPRLLSERANPNWNALWPQYCQDVTRLQRAFADALKIAMYAREAFSGDTLTVAIPYTQSFLRYFEAGQERQVWSFISCLFQSPTTDPNTLVYGVGNPAFDNMQAFYNNWPFPRDPNDCSVTEPDGSFIEAYLTQFLPWTAVAQRGAALEVCPRLFGVSPQGVQTYPDFSAVLCQDFGNPPQASETNMRSLPAILLHEFWHFNALYGRGGMRPVVIADWNPKDLPNQNPPDGYGPVNAALVNQRNGAAPIAPNTLSPNPLNNSDNFLYFALEVYFQSVCALDPFSDPQ